MYRISVTYAKKTWTPESQASRQPMPTFCFDDLDNELLSDSGLSDRPTPEDPTDFIVDEDILKSNQNKAIKTYCRRSLSTTATKRPLLASSPASTINSPRISPAEPQSKKPKLENNNNTTKPPSQELIRIGDFFAKLDESKLPVVRVEPSEVHLTPHQKQRLMSENTSKAPSPSLLQQYDKYTQVMRQVCQVEPLSLKDYVKYSSDLDVIFD